jgi:hypothetical protein
MAKEQTMEHCYINVTRARGGWVGQVITRQDYHERGPHARTHQTPLRVEYDTAREDA